MAGNDLGGKKGLIDSNILIYAYDASETEKHPLAAEFVSEMVLNGSAVFSAQVFSEFSSAATEKLENALGTETAKQILLDLSKASRVVSHNEKTVIEALNVKQACKVHFWDALVAATMREHGITVIFTENEKDFRKISWIEAINPLKRR
ncbi:MAG: PIN domain-containing protein [Candidatus Diapherotrites archaeon]|nr:PIN domain-containing protein [Candidatus Diapherotrites archaeon]